jgi:hypothetical protein
VRSRSSPCRGGRGCTPRRRISASHVGTASLPSLSVSRRVRSAWK